jgi:hypothetical protein
LYLEPSLNLVFDIIQLIVSVPDLYTTHANGTNNILKNFLFSITRRSDDPKEMKKAKIEDLLRETCTYFSCFSSMVKNNPMITKKIIDILSPLIQSHPLPELQNSLSKLCLEFLRYPWSSSLKVASSS